MTYQLIKFHTTKQPDPSRTILNSKQQHIQSSVMQPFTRFTSPDAYATHIHTIPISPSFDEKLSASILYFKKEK